MSEPLICEMPGCGGVLKDDTFPLQTGCSSYSPCRACDKCGRVHSYDGHLMFNRPGAAAYLKDGMIDLVMEPKNFEAGKTYKTTAHVNVCLENKEGDCVAPDVVQLEPGTSIVFDSMDEDTYRFHGLEGTEYRLHRSDINFVE